MGHKRTIESILDLKTGREVFASDFLNKPIEEIFKYRYEFETDIRENSPRFVCYICRQAIKIRGQVNSKKILHFAHLRDSAECYIKTNNKLTKEEILRIKYNRTKESDLHKELKLFIANSLRINQEKLKGVEFVETELINKHQAIPKVWKRPDVTSKYLNKDVVFEIQLSTTFLSVINSRQEFYKENKIFIIWVFNAFETDDEKRKFTQSDVFYNNNMNGFELDEESKRKSIQMGDLILKCYYLKPSIRDKSIINEWNSEYVSLTDLTFDANTYKVYYYDVESNHKKLKEELEVSNSRLIKLIETGNESEIYNLFWAGYKTSEYEIKYVNTLYAKHVKSEKIIHGSTIGYRIIIATICLKLDNTELIRTYINNYALNRTIIDILSLKLKKIIGYSFKNIIQISHRLIDSRPEHLDLYLLAINKYWPDFLEKEDTSGKFMVKLKKVKQLGTKQTYDTNIILKIFPDLFKS